MTKDSCQQTFDRAMMARALNLALNGAGHVSPNPMVGAVITAPDGRIIGEGWHRRFGGPHAEVNAIASVKESDRKLLSESTIYVTLEPCSHYGKTPPCAKLLSECGFHRVVAAIEDPNPKVAGRGLKMIAESGIEVTTGILAQEATEINRRFLTAQIKRRPWIQLKWCESADGFIAQTDGNGNPKPITLSSPLGRTWMHRERSMADAIIIGSTTALTDHPRLDPRGWPGEKPLRVVADRTGRVDLQKIYPDGNVLRIGANGETLSQAVARLRQEHEIGAIMVEGGTRLLEAFIKEGLFDEIRVEKVPVKLGIGIKVPTLPPTLSLKEKFTLPDGSTISLFIPRVEAGRNMPEG